MQKTRTFRKLFHVGAMDAALKGSHGFSMEGHGLSVSECPHAWRHIARLGDSPQWTLTKPGNKFLHWRKLTQKAKEQLFTWAQGQGLIYRAPAWVVEWYDDELQATMCSLHPTRELALAEADDNVIESAAWHATEALTKMVGYPGDALDLAFVKDMAAVAYAGAHDLDGVYWAETLDVLCLSAPRAVILPEKVASWTVVPSPA